MLDGRSIAAFQAAAPWTAFDNCQILSAAHTQGNNGSETRNLVFGALAVLGLVGVAASSCATPALGVDIQRRLNVVRLRHL